MERNYFSEEKEGDLIDAILSGCGFILKNSNLSVYHLQLSFCQFSDGCLYVILIMQPDLPVRT